MLRKIKKKLSYKWKMKLKGMWHNVRKINAGNRMKPNFIIVGAQKCGTSSIFNHIAQHPDILEPLIKEINYFNNENNYKENNIDEGERWYKAYFPLTPKHSKKQTFEATPMYLFHPRVAKRIYDFNPEIKIIVMLRNPTSRAISHYYHEVARSREKLELIEAVQQEEQRTKDAIENNLFNTDTFKNFTYKARGRYAEQISRYLEYFPAKQLHIMFSEDFFRDPSDELAKLFRFVGVDDTFNVPDLPAANVSWVEKKKDQTQEVDYLNAYFAPYNEDLFTLIGRRLDW